MRRLPQEYPTPGLDRAGLVDFLAAQPDVIAAYLFGSLVNGRARPDSDIDLAILLAASPRREEEEPDLDQVMAEFEREMALIEALEAFVEGRRLDVVFLQRAPLLLRFQVLTTGRLLYENPDRVAERVEFEVRTFKFYFDQQPLREFAERILHQDIREGRFGERQRHYYQPPETSG